MSERGSPGTNERDQLSKIIFMFSGFTFSIGVHSISEEFVGFYPLSFWGIYIEEAFVGFFPLGFSQDKSCVPFYGCAYLSFSDPVYMLLL